MFLLNPRLLLVALAFLFSSFLNAAVPLILEYSGRVSSGGSPFTGSGTQGSTGQRHLRMKKKETPVPQAKVGDSIGT
jgi:hypothetical protein